LFGKNCNRRGSLQAGRCRYASGHPKSGAKALPSWKTKHLNDGSQALTRCPREAEAYSTFEILALTALFNALSAAAGLFPSPDDVPHRSDKHEHQEHGVVGLLGLPMSSRVGCSALRVGRRSENSVACDPLRNLRVLEKIRVRSLHIDATRLPENLQRPDHVVEVLEIVLVFRLID